MNNKVKSRLEIIEETAQYYNETNRAVDKIGNCVYYDSITDKMCAVGRCLKDPKNTLSIPDIIDVCAKSLFKNYMTFDDLKDEYRIEDTNFWSDLQAFHDYSWNWNENGLTEQGIKKI